MEKNGNTDELEILSRFLSTFEGGVEARGRRKLSVEEEEALRNLASGEIGDPEKRELVFLLARNEAAMEFLAKLIG